MAGFINGRCAILSGLAASFSPVRRLGKGREVVQRFLKVYEAYMGSHEHKVKIEEFYYYHKRFPKSNAEAGVGREKYSEYADSIEIRKNGVVIISLSPELSRNGKLILNPKRTSNEK